MSKANILWMRATVVEINFQVWDTGITALSRFRNELRV